MPPSGHYLATRAICLSVCVYVCVRLLLLFVYLFVFVHVCPLDIVGRHGHQGPQREVIASSNGSRRAGHTGHASSVQFGRIECVKACLDAMF